MIRRLPTWALFGGVMLGATAVVLAVSVLTNGFRSPPSASPGPSDVPAPSAETSPFDSQMSSAPVPTSSTTPLALAPEPLVAVGWQEMGFDGVTGTVNSLMATPAGGLMAVGAEEFDGAIWLSPGGAKWHGLTGLPRVAETEAASLWGIREAGSGLIALGWIGGRGYGEAGTWIWASQDGQTWQAAAGPAELNGRVLQVLSGGQGLIGVGSRFGLNNLTGAVAWTSADGTKWTESPSIVGSDGAGMYDVTAVEGGFLAVGAVGTGVVTTSDGATWSSADGVNWTRQPPDPAFADAALNQVVNWGGTLVVGGSVEIREQPGHITRPVIWASGPGETWTRVFSPDCCGHLLQLLASDGALWALYGWYQPEGPYAYVLLRSVDGRTWETVGRPSGDPDMQVIALAHADGYGLFVLGYRALTETTREALMLRPPTTP